MSQSNWRTGFLLAALVAFVGGALPCRATYLVSNGDMELGGGLTTPPTYWNAGDGVVGVTGDTPDGSAQSMSVLNDGNGFYEGLAWQDAPFNPLNGRVQLAFSYKGDGPRWDVLADGVTSIGADHPGASVGAWTDYATPWKTVPSGTTFLRILLYDIVANGDNPVFFDNVMLIVPEPGSALLLGAGVLGVAGTRRRRGARRG